MPCNYVVVVLIMGLFDVFSRKPAIQKHIERATNRRAQAVERGESLRFLANDGSPEAIRALLQRLSFRVDPGITDQQEKDDVARWLVKIGEPAVPEIKAYLSSADGIARPLQILAALTDEDTSTAILLELLSSMDTEYERDPQKKLDILGALANRKHDSICDAVAPFLQDVNETCRFYAANAMLTQSNAEAHEPTLRAALVSEESVRTRARILEGYADNGWKVSQPVSEVQAVVPKGIRVSQSGVVTRG